MQFVGQLKKPKTSASRSLDQRTMQPHYHRMRYWLVLLLCFELQTPGGAETLQEEASAFQSRHLFSGSGVTLTKIEHGGEPVYASAGLLRKDGEPISSSTLFEIGSITKAFTGILLADAVLSEKASLDDSLDVHLSGFQIDQESPLRTITLKELATHTSGLPRIPANLFEGADQDDPYAHYDSEKLILYLRTISTTDLKERGKLSYSNLGMGLLGHILERIHEKPYEQILDEKILSPLGMTNTFLQRTPDSIPESVKNSFATGHTRRQETAHWHIDGLSAAGAIVSSSEDLAKFVRAHWSDTIPASLQKAIDLATETHAPGIGLGWFLSKNGLSHDGGTGGFRSEMRINPKTKSARIKLINNSVQKKQTSYEGDFSSLEGIWTGTLVTGKKDLRLVYIIAESGEIYNYSIDQAGGRTDATETSFDGSKLVAAFSGIGGTFTGDRDGDILTGTWSQGKDYPLTLTRAEKLPESLRKILEKKVSGDIAELDGYWSGFLGGEEGLFVVLQIDAIGTTGDVQLFSPDQTQQALPISSFSFEGGVLKLEAKAINGTYTAKRNDRNELFGLWNQGFPQPLTLIHSDTMPERD